MEKRDFYEVLGVSRTCDGGELKSAYRKLAMQFHPDRNAGDPAAESKFKEVNEAYEALRNPEKRAAYDRFGHAGLEGGMGGGYADFSGFGDIGSIFDEFFVGFGASSFGT